MAHVIPNFGNGYDDEDFEPNECRDVVCKRCGADGLHWVHTGARWALADSKGLHSCTKPAPAGAFEVEKPDDLD